MNRDLWIHELRRLGWPAVVAPGLAVTFLCFLAWFGGEGRQSGRVLSMILDVLPLTAGIAAATTTGGDRSLELQLSLPTRFRTTVVRRLTLALAWPALLACGMTIYLLVTRQLTWPINSAGSQLVWLAPLLWLAAFGAVATLGLRAVAAGAGLVGVLWLVEEIGIGFFSTTSWGNAIWLFFRFRGTDGAAWYWNRACVLAFALALFALAYRELGRSERLLTGEW